MARVRLAHLRRTPGATIAIVSIGVILTVMIVAPMLFSKGASELNVFLANQGPGSHHWLGTDNLGRDILKRLLVATRLSIGLALIATSLSAVFGFALGGGAAVLPQRVRPLALRFIDMMLAFPALLVAIFVGAIIGPGATGATLGVGIAGSFYVARVASTLAISVTNREYVVAARVLGVRRSTLLTRYILANTADSLVVVITATIANAIVFLSALSFLGLGVQSPQIDWGQMLTQGVQQFYLTPVAALAPAIAIALTALSFGFAGDALARLLNPLLWTAGGSERPEPQHAPASSGRQPVPVSLRQLDDEPVLDVSELFVSAPSNGTTVDIVSDVSFSVARGEILGIVGESGSGKTTIANAIAQLIQYPAVAQGTIRLCGSDLSELSSKQRDRLLGTSVATVFQDPLAALNPALRIGTQVTESARFHQGLSRGTAIARAIDLFREVHLPAAEHQIRRYPHELSGGMRQRTTIAMGLMNRPALLIADEPTTALDVTIQAQIMDILQSINRTHGTAMVMISHNLALIGQNCHRILITYAGRIVEELPADDLSDAHHPYTRGLVGSVPDMSQPLNLPLTQIPGSVPDIHARPSGCAFHPRCPLAEPICGSEVPPLLGRNGRRRVACWVANSDLTSSQPR